MDKEGKAGKEILKSYSWYKKNWFEILFFLKYNLKH